MKTTGEDRRLVCIENLTSLARGGKMLHNLSFDLMAGEVYVVLSAFAYNQLNFIDLFDGNIIEYRGRFELFGAPYQRKERYEAEIQMIGLEPSIFPRLSVAENIMIAGMHFNRRGLLRQATSLMEELGVFLDLSKPVSKMVVDEQKTIELLRICAMQPRIAVFVDVKNYLGDAGRMLVPRVLEWLKAHGTGIVYATSNLEDSLEIGDRISVLDNGTNKGTFLAEEVRENPAEIAYLLSGWQPLVEEGGAAGGPKLTEALTSIDEIMTSDYELKRVLGYLAADLVKVADAKASLIYLIDENRINLIDVISGKASVTQLPRLAPVHFTGLLQRDGVQCFVKGDAEFESLFGDAGDIQSILCYAIRLDGRKNALMQVAFTRVVKSMQRHEVYLQMFAKEIAMAIETSRLMGKSVLLQESHHRVKNNLQMVLNLLYLQKNSLTGVGPEVHEILDTTMCRIKSIAVVHALLSRDWFGKNVVNSKTMLLEILHMYEGLGAPIGAMLEDLTIPYDNAVSLALVVNELISNAVKHAFPQPDRGDCIMVETHNTGISVVLTVRDNGTGFDAADAYERSSSVGLSIVRSIVRELQGELCASGQAGTCVTITFPRYTIIPMQVHDVP